MHTLYVIYNKMLSIVPSLENLTSLLSLIVITYHPFIHEIISSNKKLRCISAYTIYMDVKRAFQYKL